MEWAKCSTFEDFTHLYSVVEFRSTYYLVGKDIVVEQHILTITLIAIVLEVEPIYSNYLQVLITHLASRQSPKT